MNAKTIVILVLLGVVVLVAANSFYIVQETEKAVLLEWGRVEQADVPPGLHVKVPIMHKVRKFDGRILTSSTTEQRFLTVEKKGMMVDYFAKWRVADVDRYYRATNGDETRADQLIAQRVNAGLRNQFGERTLQEVVSGERDELMNELIDSLSQFSEQSLGVEIIDVRVKKIDLPNDVSSSVFQRMTAERQQEAQEHRSKGKEQAEVIRADADRQQTIIEAEAYRDAQELRGEGDALAAAIYAAAYNQDPEFYQFIRSLNAYRETFSSPEDLILLDPNSDFFRYLNDSMGGRESR